MRWIYNLVVFLCAFAIGWLIFNPPGWWPGGSIMNTLLWVCLGGLGLLVFFGIMIAANLPANVRIDELPASIALPAELNRLRTEYLKLGFEQVGPPMRIHVAPPAMVIGMVKPDLGIYGTIFVTGHETPKVSYDLVSMIRLPQSFSSDQGILTTGPDPGGASLPVSTGSFVQIIHEAPPKSLYRQHLLALEWLDQHKLPCDRAVAQELPLRIRESIARQRRQFLRNPVSFTLVAVWRSITKLTPHNEPLTEQALAQKHVALLASYSGR